MIWWRARYLNARPNTYKEYHNEMVPFKLLPHLKEVSMKTGHVFDTDEIEIESADGAIILHKPSNSIWVNSVPYYINNGARIILFERNYKSTSNTSWKVVNIGLLDNNGNGMILKWNTATNVIRKFKSTANVEEEELVA